jgi:GTP-binding protein
MRTKFNPMAGPDGGDGGRGGHIILRGNRNLWTLLHMRYYKNVHAENGQGGDKNNRTGRDGEDVILEVPLGTIGYDEETGESEIEILEDGQEAVWIKGGRGGLGNKNFATPTNQAPDYAQPGEPGVEGWKVLELKVLADVGLVGLPNAGKSTTLAALTAAQPKIGEYPFTTLEPNLGVIELGLEDGRRPTVADLPGLIEGASMGAGLGFAFLRHASRTRILVHVVDASTADPLRDAAIIREELTAHNPALLEKTTLVVLNKIDRPGVRERLEELRTGFSALGLKSIACSALGGALGEGITDLRNELAELLPDAETLALPTEPAGVVVHRIDPIAVSGFEVSRDGESYRVRGKAIERLVHQTDFARDESAQRFHHELKRQGIESALRKAGCRAGDTVVIGELSLEWEDPDEADLLNTADAAEASDLDLEELGETLEEAAVGSSEGSQ